MRNLERNEKIEIFSFGREHLLAILLIQLSVSHTVIKLIKIACIVHYFIMQNHFNKENILLISCITGIIYNLKI